MPQRINHLQKDRDLPQIAHEVHLRSRGRMAATSLGETYLNDVALLYLALQHWEDSPLSCHPYDQAVSELVSASLLEATERLAIEVSGLDDQAFYLQDRSAKNRHMDEVSSMIAEIACRLEDQDSPEEVH